MSSELITFLTGVIAGSILTAIPFIISGRVRIRAIIDSATAQTRSQITTLQERLNSSQAQKEELNTTHVRVQQDLSLTKDRAAVFESKCSMLTEQLQSLKETQRQRELQISELNETITNSYSKIAHLETTIESERRRFEEKFKLLNEARDQLKSEFGNLANSIFDEKVKRFSEQNQSNLDLVLTPLRDQLGEFRKRVDDVYTSETRERQSLFEQIKSLTALNQQVSKDAENLTRALKGDNKAQGNWGEMILERALEISGLKKGVEFDTQFSSTNDEGQKMLPDVVVHLPEGRDVVIDSKVSLIDYQRAVEAADETERDNALKNHLRSVRNHIDGLSSKSYDSLFKINSLDYVLMFMPVEAAFVWAVRKDPALFEYAYRKRIILVSPATLLVTLRTIQNMWQSEYQNRNAQNIAKKAADLYDKIAGFIDTFTEIQKAIDGASGKCNKALKQLSTGKGNILKRVEEFKVMGVKPKKNLPPEILETDFSDTSSLTTSDSG
ncbi:DNA recombination protein RmuC [Chitinispirillales bacterium ANBcel5]|uniref:DNA recombination protein RmuC n=1 Tax=Cellulosispirillum alkaliphilum TaxID=3039283 RepID=UPI002A552C7B|nr:DNA recombination protein RmuC [Chitinispirillales bacterium ANBcel5]